MKNHQEDPKKPIHSTDEDSSGKLFDEEKARKDKYYLESGDVPIEIDYTGKTLGEEIQDDLTKIIDDFKQALDCLFDVIKDLTPERPTGFGMGKKWRSKKLKQAREIYYNYFV